MPFYKVTVIEVQSIVVEADDEESAKEQALDAATMDRTWENQEVEEVVECDEKGNPLPANR